MNTMKKDLASARKLSEGEERLLRELDAVRAERNKAVDALLEACKLAKYFLDGLGYSGGDVFESLVTAIDNAEK